MCRAAARYIRYMYEFVLWQAVVQLVADPAADSARDKVWQYLLSLSFLRSGITVECTAIG